VPVLTRLIPSPVVVDIRRGAMDDLAGLLADQRISASGKLAIAISGGSGRALRERLAPVLPGEIFVELGLAVKQNSPFKHTIIAELANGSIGYVPSKRAYKQGNYEVVSARCAEGSGELLVEAALRLLRELSEKK